jgi:hypothetical protein
VQVAFEDIETASLRSADPQRWFSGTASSLQLTSADTYAVITGMIEAPLLMELVTQIVTFKR